MKFQIQTKGHYDFIDITPRISKTVKDSGVKDGIAVVCVKGSTAALTTMEYEPGIIKDVKKVFESLAPEQADYEHHKKWGDRNGAAHIKSALVKTDITITISQAQLDLGTWQQIVLIDFDEKSRTREITVMVIPSKA